MKQLGHRKMPFVATRTRKRKIPTLSMSPMIDCVFLLLIFFMVSTTFSPMPGIRVELPPGFDGFDPPKGFAVSIDNPTDNTEVGTMLLNGQIVTYDDIFTQLLNAPDEQKSMLTIRAERGVLHKQVVRVIDTAKDAGVDNIGFVIPARE